MVKRSRPSKFALERGRLIRQAREQAKMSPGELAERFSSKSRPWVISLEKGEIERLDVRDGRVLISELGMNPSQLEEKEQGDPSMYGDDLLPEASFQARRVARLWDQLPAPMQEYLWANIESYRKLNKEQPAIARMLGLAPPAD